MDMPAVAALARELMDAHGLNEWGLRFDRARRRAGMTSFSDSTISLSRVLMPLFDEDDVRGTILHEIAHAIVGPDHGHDSVWKATARSIGAPDRARLTGSAGRRASDPAPNAAECSMLNISYVGIGDRRGDADACCSRRGENSPGE